MAEAIVRGLFKNQNRVGYAVGRGREDGEYALGREGAEATVVQVQGPRSERR